MNFSRALVAAVLILAGCFIISACGSYWKQTYPTISPPSRPEPCVGENCNGGSGGSGGGGGGGGGGGTGT